MSRLGKTLVSVGSLLIVAVVGILIYCYWPAITGTVNNNKYYTQEDVQKAYDDGFSDGNKSETELTAKYEYYKTLVDDYYIQVTTLNEEITKLSIENASYNTQVKTLTNQKNNLQSQVDTLNTIKANNEITIADLNNQISSLQSQITNLTNSGEDKSEQIANLNTQVTNLQKTVNQLQKTNQMNLDTIINLNAQIASLNSQISEITLLSQNSSNIINNLNNKINELEKSITYYESYISQLESSEQVVATFEFDGSVYNIQIVNKGSKLAVATPTSTTYKIFNGWTINGEIIDLNNYTILTNTKIIADITYKYDVKFKVDDELIDSQIITKNSCAVSPNNPTKAGYDFDGWSANGIDIISDIENVPVIENITYKAVFTKLHTVTFVYENETKFTQTIRNGSCASNIDIENTKYKVFKGWTVNNTLIEIENYKITKDTVFVADIEYYFDVKFTVDNNTINSQIIVENGIAKSPENPTKDGYRFLGWTTNGTDIVNITDYEITTQTKFIAMFIKTYNVKFYVDNSLVKTITVDENTNISSIETPYKPGYEFVGWLNNGSIINIETIKITSDMELSASFIKKSLEQCSWSEISDISKTGNASSYFKVGDTKNITLSTGETITVAIMGFNHDNLTGGGKAGITFGMTELLATKYTMHSSNSNAMSWNGTDMRNNVLVMLKSFMPTELQNSIKLVNKRTSAGNKSTDIVISSDSLWLFSETEIYGSGKLGSGDEGSQYTYYQTIRNGKDVNGQIKRLGNGSGDKAWYFLRSPRTNVSTAFCSFGAAGGLYGNTPTTAGGVCFGFCI